MINDSQIIKNIRKSLLNWYPFQAGFSILYVGRAEEDWAGGINCCDGEINYITVDSILENKLLKKYDYIILIEAIEQILNPLDVLNSLKNYLTTKGIMLLGMNNRFGLRYFCGDRDKYTKRNFDGIENYKKVYTQKEDKFAGRMYNKAEIQKMLVQAGFVNYKFYSVFPNLENPTFIYAEDYLPNEDLGNRVFPMYESPETIFLEEESLYGSLIENGMFHNMANAYFIECAFDDIHTDVLQVTSSFERKKEDIFMTVIRAKEQSNGHKRVPATVEKRAAYPEGVKRYNELIVHNNYLREHGIKVVDAKILNSAYVMPYIEAEVGQLYLKKLLLSGNIDGFIQKMDYFRTLILKSSDIIKPDAHDGRGAVLERGFMDLVPLNSFYIDEDFVFFDQEFSEENYPANALIFRMIATFYHENLECEKILPPEFLYKRYELMDYLEEWRSMELNFLSKLRNEKALWKYHELHRRNNGIVNTNRQRMNYSQERYERLFRNIFEQADTRKLILFGSGNYAKRVIDMYGKDYDIYAVVDNNSDKWGTKVRDITIQPPNILNELKNGEYKIIICMKNYMSVMEQLEEMGIKDFSVYDWNGNYSKKLRPIEKESNLIARSEASAKKKYHIGYVAGAFDMFHVGHLNLLRQAKEQCDYLIVGVIADENIYKLKNKYPIISLKDRVAIVASCRYVDQAEALPVEHSGIKDAYRMFHFDVQFSGDDHNQDEKWLADRDYLEKNGADIVFFKYTEGISTTKIREQIN